MSSQTLCWDCLSLLLSFEQELASRVDGAVRPHEAPSPQALPAGAKAVTQGQFKLFQEALKATHSGRWSHKSQVKIPGEANYVDM